jgi:butyrate kinase
MLVRLPGSKYNMVQVLTNLGEHKKIEQDHNYIPATRFEETVDQTEFRRDAIAECLESLISMYQSRGDEGSVAIWQEELDSIIEKIQPK